MGGDSVGLLMLTCSGSSKINYYEVFGFMRNINMLLCVFNAC